MALAAYSGDFLEQELNAWAEPWRLDCRRRFVAACLDPGAVALHHTQPGVVAHRDTGESRAVRLPWGLYTRVDSQFGDPRMLAEAASGKG